MTTAQAAARRPSARERARATAAAVPVWAWLVAIVATSTLLRYALALSVHAPWVFQDEIVYADLARSFGTTGHFALRGVPGSGGFGPVYPILISPAYALFGSMPHAYLAIKLINCVLMSLAAVPAYLIGRGVLTRPYALAGAVFAVAIPSLAYTNTIMSENAFYPAFMSCAAALVLLLERPTLLRQLSFFVFFALAFFSRAQGVILLPALVAAIVLLVVTDAWGARDWSWRAVGRRLDAFRATILILGGGAVLAVAYALARGRSLKSLLGAYQNVTNGSYGARSTLRWLIFHLAELDISVGVVAFAALLVVAAWGLAPRVADRGLRAFAAAAVPLVLAFAVTAAAYATQPAALRIEERYLFYVAPLFFIALLAWVERGLVRGWPGAGVAAVVAAALPGALPYQTVVNTDNVHDAMALVPFLRFEQHGLTPASLPTLAVIGGIVGGVLLLTIPARLRWLAPAVVGVWLLATLVTVQRHIDRASADALRAGIQAPRDWIDRRVGSSADVALLSFPAPTALPYWENEVFNRSVRRAVGPSIYDALPVTFATWKSSGVFRTAAGTVPRAPYVLAYYTVVPAGKPIAVDKGAGMVLYRTRGPIVLREKIDGVYPDRWSGSTVSYTRYGCGGGSVAARLLSDRDLHPYPLTIVARDGAKEVARRVLPPSLSAQTMVVPLRSSGGVCAVTFDVSPTAVPSQVTGAPDNRQLGIRFLSFAYSRRR